MVRDHVCLAQCYILQYLSRKLAHSFKVLYELIFFEQLPHLSGFTHLVLNGIHREEDVELGQRQVWTIEETDK